MTRSSQGSTPGWLWSAVELRCPGCCTEPSSSEADDVSAVKTTTTGMMQGGWQGGFPRARTPRLPPPKGMRGAREECSRSPLLQALATGAHWGEVSLSA